MKLNVTDQKMLEAFDRLIENRKERFKSDICANMNIHLSSVNNIRIGKQHFSAEHIRLFAKYYNVNLNFIFGFEEIFFAKKKAANKNVNKRLETA